MSGVPLPLVQPVGPSLRADVAALVQALADQFADLCWKDRALLVDGWLRRVVAVRSGDSMPEAIDILTAVLEARDDATIVCDDQAGLYMTARHVGWRAAANTWFEERGQAACEDWQREHLGVVALFSTLFAECAAAGGLKN